MAEPEDIAKKRRGRLRLLEEFYDLVGTSTLTSVGISEDDDGSYGDREHAKYLVDRGLLKFASLGYNFYITPRGIDFVEELIMKKKEPSVPTSSETASSW